MTSSGFSTVKVSELPPVNLGTIDGKDHFIINDNEGATKTTNIIEIGDFIGYIEATDLTFTGDITFVNTVFFGGDILPIPGGELNITTDSITIRQELNVESTAVVNGLDLNDLEDVEYEENDIVEGHILVWDEVNEVFITAPQIDNSPVYFEVPPDPRPGDLWWRKDNGKLYVWYTSPNGSSNWVQASGSFVDLKDYK